MAKITNRNAKEFEQLLLTPKRSKQQQDRLNYLYSIATSASLGRHDLGEYIMTIFKRKPSTQVKFTKKPAAPVKKVAVKVVAKVAPQDKKMVKKSA